jgi:hypothetical protein
MNLHSSSAGSCEVARLDYAERPPSDLTGTQRHGNGLALDYRGRVEWST